MAEPGPEVSPPESISDVVWFDQNHNMLQDPNEQGIPGVTVHLLDGNGNPVLDDNGLPVTTVTDAMGQYHFDVAPTTGYRVVFDQSTADTSGLPGGLTPTMQHAGTDPEFDADADPDVFFPASPSDGPGTNNPTYDAGYASPSTE